MLRKINLFRVLIIAFLININFIFSQDKGLDYYRNQEFEAAKNYYESIILESDNNPEAQLGKGSSSFQLGDYDSAKGAFEQSLRSNDNIIRSKALYNLGNTLYQNQKNEEALAYYRKELEEFWASDTCSCFYLIFSSMIFDLCLGQLIHSPF